MRKAICLLLVLVTIAVLFAPLGSASAMPYFEDATVKGESVNMRMRPTTDSPVVIQLSQGDRIGVFCEEVEGWYRVIYGNYRGYINAEYVFLPSEDSMVGNATVSINLRQNPGAYSNIVGTVSEGTGLTISDISGDWYLVESAPISEEEEPVRGYAHKDNVKISKSNTPTTVYKLGMSGAQIRNIQQELRKRGFLDATATGFFGEATEGAVKLFQQKAGLSSDGVVGRKTYDVLFSDAKISVSRSELYGIRDVKLSNWDSIKEVFTRGSKALVTDVRTGRQFWVKRYGGTYHADVEPLTSKDTATAKKNYGGSFSWDRRAIWVTVGSLTYAASMNFMPHANYSIKDNDYPGHFCIHFKGSRLHLSGTERAGTVCPVHQACVKYAYDKAHNK